ncbi:MAG TPA: hypothetical protein ENI05_14570 [Porticoccus sp.]|nr:hypothetical protein [Porticoccus sp.]
MNGKMRVVVSTLSVLLVIGFLAFYIRGNYIDKDKNAFMEVLLYLSAAKKMVEGCEISEESCNDLKRYMLAGSDKNRRYFFIEKNIIHGIDFEAGVNAVLIYDKVKTKWRCVGGASEALVKACEPILSYSSP